jgi:hypothetical protein
MENEVFELQPLGPAEPVLFDEIDCTERDFLKREFLSYMEVPGPSGRRFCFLVQAVAAIRAQHVASLFRSLFVTEEPNEQMLQIWQALADNQVFIGIFATTERKRAFIVQRPAKFNIVALCAADIVFAGSSQHLVGQRDGSIAVLCQMWLHFGLRVADASFYKKKIVRLAGVAWNAGTFKPSHNEMQRIAEEATALGQDVDLDAASVLRYVALGLEVHCGLWEQDPSDDGKAGEGEFNFIQTDDLQKMDSLLHKLLVDMFGTASKVSQVPKEWWLARSAEEKWCIEKQMTEAEIEALHNSKEPSTLLAEEGAGGFYGADGMPAGGGGRGGEAGAGSNDDWAAPGAPGSADTNPVQFELRKWATERQRWGPGGATRLLGAVKGWSSKNLFLALHNAASGKVEAFSGSDKESVATVKKLALTKKEPAADWHCNRPRWEWADEWAARVDHPGSTDEEGWR